MRTALRPVVDAEAAASPRSRDWVRVDVIVIIVIIMQIGARPGVTPTAITTEEYHDEVRAPPPTLVTDQSGLTDRRGGVMHTLESAAAKIFEV